MSPTMSPDQFLSSLAKSGPAPVYLFLGPEAYQRERCRRELIRAALGDDPEARENGFARHDLSETTLASALDDARAMSLFASRRLIWIASAEAALPRTRASAREQSDEEGPKTIAMPRASRIICANLLPRLSS